jgi:hypothetical protein
MQIITFQSMEIIAKRFLLRDFTVEDEPEFFAYHSDPRYAEFCSPEQVTPEHTRKPLHAVDNGTAPSQLSACYH